MDKKVKGADSNRFQDCFIKVKIVVFFYKRSETGKRNWQSKSVFLAFTIPTEGDGKIIGKYYYLEFEFKKKAKSFMEFRKQIGSVFRLNLRISQLNIEQKWSRDRLCRLSGPLIFTSKVIIS